MMVEITLMVSLNHSMTDTFFFLLNLFFMRK